jgi:glutamate--cysteine ligase
MSTRLDTAPSEPIRSRDDLAAWIEAGAKPKSQWLIGTEHEKFVFDRATLAPVPYEGPRGIRALMMGLMECCGWEPVMEGKNIIALKKAPGKPGGTVSLEPAGQFELSGAPLATLHETAAETRQHLDEARRAASRLGLGFLGVGFSPRWTLAETPGMPKARYEVMTAYMPKVGSHGLDMMYRTSTIQTNLDFADEADMVKKLRVGLALQPVATALFASSPFTEGRPNGFKSMRSEVWRDTDKSRTGMLPFVFEPGMGYEAYVDYALSVPMYFVYRDGRYIDVAGASFRDFMAGKLPGLEGVRATLDDWSDHLTTLFPEVRLKRFMEMRGADGGGEAAITALSAFWTGLLYDGAALDAAWSLVADWTAEERQRLRDEVPRSALDTPFRGGTLRDVARNAVAISRQGLAARRRLDAEGRDETRHLAYVEAIAESGRTLADELLERYHGEWKGRVDPVFDAYAF